jgi:hypothetical protein
VAPSAKALIASGNDRGGEDFLDDLLVFYERYDPHLERERAD